LLTASDYGIPQKRQRAIWIGSKFGEVVPPLESDKKITVGDAISDLSHIPINSQTDTWELGKKGEYAEYLDNIFPCISKSIDISGFQATAHTAATQQKYGDTIPGEKEPTTWAYRLSTDGFSPTLRAGSGNRTATRPIHYEHARVITVRARLLGYTVFPIGLILGQVNLRLIRRSGIVCHRCLLMPLLLRYGRIWKNSKISPLETLREQQLFCDVRGQVALCSRIYWTYKPLKRRLICEFFTQWGNSQEKETALLLGCLIGRMSKWATSDALGNHLRWYRLHLVLE
jgi:hypothetical protein